MQLTYDQEQKEQVWRALGFRNVGGDCYNSPDEGLVGPDSLPKPEDVLWQLRSLAIEKDDWGYHYALTNTLTEGEQEDRDLYQKYLSCATPQQIFEAALKTLEDE